MRKSIGDRFSYDTEKVRIGGFAQVYRGVDLNTSPPREVAIKILDVAAATEPMLRMFYDREVESLLTLNHSNIVELIDAGIDTDGKYYLILEWIESDLKTWLSGKGAIPWEDFINAFGLPIAQALDFAHQLRIIHRDVKPENVLITSTGIPKLADFGISKIKSDLTQSPHTTIDFMSRPYSPPEQDSTFSRDVFGFGVLLIGALGGIELHDYPDISRTLKELDIPVELSDLLARCVNLSPESRPKNAQVMLEEFKNLMSNRASKRRIKSKVQISISRSVESKWIDLHPGRSSNFAAEILSDLNGSANIRQADEPTHFGQVEGRHVFIGGAEFSYRAVVVIESGIPNFKLTGVLPWLPGRAERSFKLDLPLSDYEFTTSSPLSAKAAIESMDSLIKELESHNRKRDEELGDKEDRRLLDQWKSQLLARQELERRREKPIKYQSIKKKSNRIVFEVSSDTSGIEIGELRKVEMGEASDWQPAGEVEVVNEHEVQIWFEFSPKKVPESGKLVLDTAAASIKIMRERAALEGLIHRSPEVVNQSLRNVVINPTTQELPKPTSVTSWFKSDLDEDKKVVVEAALGSNGMFAVEGPPGTGKTTFIAELVAQEIARNPAAKILISSQTNVALDNALVRVIGHVPSSRVIRLADRSGLKVSEDAKQLLLESQVENWRKKTQKNARKQFETWCISVGLNASDIDFAGSVSQILKLRKTEDAQRLSASVIRIKLDDKKLPITDDDRIKMDDEFKNHERRARKAKKEYQELQVLHAESGKAIGIDISNSVLQELEEVSRSLLEPIRGFEGKIELALGWIQRLETGDEFEEALLANAQVIGGTCIGIARHKDVKSLKFDLCIVDEASKATATETLVPLVRSKRWVLVGDQRQLPPFQESALQDRNLIDEFNLDESELKTTLFDRMLTGLPEHSRMSLRIQRRMAEPIGELVSQCFYDGKLDSRGPASFSSVVGVLPSPITWWTTSSLPTRFEESGGKDRKSFSNPSEVKAIRDLLGRIGFVRKAGQLLDLSEILVIAPYSAQVNALRRQIDGMTGQLEGLHIETNSIDAVQGREADLVIFSTVRSNENFKVGFLDSDKRVNVALSRAKRGLIIVGDSTFLSSADSPFRNVIGFIEANSKYGRIEWLS